MVDRLSVDNTLDKYLAHINNNKNTNTINNSNNNHNSMNDESNNSNSIHNSNNNIHDNNNIHATNNNNNTTSSICFTSREELGRFIIPITDETEYLDFLQLSLADWLEQGMCMCILYNILSCVYNICICAILCMLYIVYVLYMLEQGMCMYIYV